MRIEVARLSRALDNPGLALGRHMPVKGDKECTDDVGLRKKRAELVRVLSGRGGTASKAYLSVFSEWEKAVAALEAWTFTGELRSRMTIGLGEPSALENGLTLNHTYGVPVIPGSSIKGAVKAAAREMDGGKEGEALDLVFGTTEGVGEVGFLDAWWDPADGRSPFAVETWTAHHQNYMSGNCELPTETESPNPIGLVAIRQSTRFRFAILLPDDGWQSALQPVMERALSRGLGAKRSQGYGRFKVKDWPLEQPKREAVPGTQRASAVSVEEKIGSGAPLRNGPQTLEGIVIEVRPRGGTIRFPGHGTVQVTEKCPKLEVGMRVNVKVSVSQGKLSPSVPVGNVNPI